MGRSVVLMLVVAVAWSNRADAQRNRYGEETPRTTTPPMRSFTDDSAAPLQPLSTLEDPPAQPPQQNQQSPPRQEPLSPAAPNNYATGGVGGPASTSAATAAPVTTTAPAADSAMAERLMSHMLKRPEGSQLSGTPVTLHEVIASASTRGEQTSRVNAYWDLCSATSDYYLSLHEQNELSQLARHTGGRSPVLRAAVERLQTRLDTALTAAKASQALLASQMKRTTSSPLPGDMPLCVSYKPKFEANFPSGAPQEAVELNRLLPLRHAELLVAAANVLQSEQYVNQVVQRAGSDPAAVEAEFVKALELLALHRRAFVQIARDYNRRITRYTELAKPGTLGSERLVAMLIKTDKQATARETTSPSRYDGRRSDVTPPPTFRSEEGLPRDDFAPRLPNDQGVQPANFDDEPTEPAAVTDQLPDPRVQPGERSVIGNPPE